MRLFDPSDFRPVHFMGIAGAGMSALALIARRRGVSVTGCDLEVRDAADLVRDGVPVLRGHDAAHVVGARAVVHTSAVPAHHDELRAAATAGIPVVKRAVALGELVNGKTVVGVAGTHGKTTTTAMTVEGLTAAGCRPTGLVGGRVATWGGNAKLDGDDLFVVEADEYDRSFLALDPTVAIVNNVEADHLECYGSLDALEAAFVEFANRAERVLIGVDDRGASRLVERLSVPVWTVGLQENADVRVDVISRGREGSRVCYTIVGRPSVEALIPVPGLHNVRNAAMAIAACAALDADVQAAARALEHFGGVGRRFDVLGTHRGVTVVDDYAHHPSEVVATIAAARQRFPDARLLVVFQPHLFTRTRDHAESFGISLSTADKIFVTDVYPARERPIPGVTGRLVVEAVERAGAEVDWVPDRSKIPDRLVECTTAGDVVLMLGAGSITETAAALVQRLAAAAA
jgi:UDP-N-acetylmuramate--alanine ligase